MLNNVFNVIIDLSINEIIYDFKIRDALFNFFTTLIEIDLSIKRLKYRQKTIDATVFVNVKIKIYYDVRHISLLFKTKNYVYFRLYHKYQLSNRLNKFFFQQRCEFFLIKRKIKRLIYKLKLSSI